MERMCEVTRLNDLGRLYSIKRALEERGVYAEVREDMFGGRLRIRDRSTPRLVVRERDLVYARWVVYAAGVDPWPEVGDEVARRSADGPRRDARAQGRDTGPQSPARPARAGG